CRSGSRTGMDSPGGSSAALTAAATPAAPPARVRSTARTRPCATGERTPLAPSSPRAWNPSAKAPRPRSSLGSSFRGTGVPITVIGGSRSWLARGAAGPGGGQHRRDDALVAGAPAKVGRDELPDLRLGRLLTRPGRRLAVWGGGRHEASFGKKCLGKHQEAGRAKPALQRVMVAECLLQVGQLVAVGQALHRADLRAVGLHPEDQAGARRRAVQPHRARAADAVLAAHVGAGVAEVVAEHVGKRPRGPREQPVPGAVAAQPPLVLAPPPPRLPFPFHRPVSPAPGPVSPAPGPVSPAPGPVSAPPAPAPAPASAAHTS